MRVNKVSVVSGLIYLFGLSASAPAFERDPLLEVQLHDQFIGLKMAENETMAAEYANRIWELWFQSGDAEIDQLMRDAMDRRRVYDFNGALESLNEVIMKAPG